MELMINIYITVAIALVAVILFVWAWFNLKQGLKTCHWVKAEGKVISSRVEQTGTTCEFNHPTYETLATVEYIVDGKTYRTKNVNDFVGTVSSIGKPKPAQRDSVITVYYNPMSPWEAAMILNALRFAIFLGILGVGFIALEWHWVSKTFF